MKDQEKKEKLQMYLRAFDKVGKTISFAFIKILNKFGPIKFGPNGRNGTELLEYYGSLEDKIFQRCHDTLKNNKEERDLRESLLKGNDIRERKMSLIDAVEGCFSPEVVSFWKDFYKEDAEFVRFVNTVEKLVLKGDSLKELLDNYGGKYYLLIAGNSRMSIYYEFANCVKNLGGEKELEEKEPIEIGLASVLDCNMDNNIFINNLSDKKEIMERGAFMTLIIHGLIMKDNIISKNNYKFRRDREIYAKLAKMEVSYVNDFYGKQENFLEALKRMSYYSTQMKLSKPKLIEGLYYNAIEECNDHFDDSEMNLADTDYFGHDSPTASFSGFAAKALATAIGEDACSRGENKAAQLNLLRMVGIDPTDCSLPNPNKMNQYLSVAASAYNQSSESATFFGKELKDATFAELKKVCAKKPKTPAEKLVLSEKAIARVLKNSTKKYHRARKKDTPIKLVKKEMDNILNAFKQLGASEAELEFVSEQIVKTFKKGVKAGRKEA